MRFKEFFKGFFPKNLYLIFFAPVTGARPSRRKNVTDTNFGQRGPHPEVPSIPIRGILPFLGGRSRGFFFE
jgi:hypothetical protein